jgi:hypothetical protein
MRAATSRDVAELIGIRRDVEDALAGGIVSREKVQGQWLYLASDFTGEAALEAALAALEESLDEWLLNPGRFLFGLARRNRHGSDLSKPALTLLAHELCARERLYGLPLLTQGRQTYLAFYRASDQHEIERQVASLSEGLIGRGEIGWRDLPEPTRRVVRKAWRNVVIGHGEWLGLGWQPEPGVLRAW